MGKPNIGFTYVVVWRLGVTTEVDILGGPEHHRDKSELETWLKRVIASK